MNRDRLRQVIADSVGSPNTGPVADVIDTITDAVLEAQQPQARTEAQARETRVTGAPEVRGA